ncbi:N-acetyltransferase [uncultured Enterococcus sp.]|uniref:GNAT family N-acetyltransferase n=1 Tax=uncultured Enterococcus sp. TaxID=167972 RepID=UPI0025EEEDC5|nr:GNAT family N-acetyltransferase [uncultured Enterococcus sp.]
MIVTLTKTISELLPLLLLADPSEFAIKKALEKGEVLGFIEDDRLLGALVYVEELKEIEITHLAVVEYAENRHIASRLLTHLIDLAKTKHQHTIVIKTGSTSFKQLYLYQKYHFRMVEIVPDYFTTHYAEPIMENGLRLYDQIILKLEI